MWIWLVATAKAHATEQTIAAKRHQWLSQGKDRQLRDACRSVQRYVVKDRTPPTVFWLLDADDSSVTRLITDHFGDLWNLEICHVVPQTIDQTLPAQK